MLLQARPDMFIVLHYIIRLLHCEMLLTQCGGKSVYVRRHTINKIKRNQNIKTKNQARTKHLRSNKYLSHYAISS